MRYAGIIKNDISAAPGVCVSFFTQGCPFKYVGRHNPQTWDFNGGYEFTQDTMDRIIAALHANGV
jgi:anaerobic ribonucleoside-triphosphate reductase activating protein